MKKILVPTDFSDTALKALVYAAESASKMDAVVSLLHVIEPDENRVWRPHASESEYERVFTNERLSRLDTLWKNMLHTYPDLTIITELAKGLVAETILEYAEKQMADLIVMGTTGATGWKQVLVGSVTAKIVGKSEIPVLAVPASYEMKQPDVMMLATNHFELDKNVIDPVIELATVFHAGIEIVVFIDIDDAKAEDYIYYGRKLQEYKERMTKRYPEIRFHSELLEGHRFDQSIEAYYSTHDIDLMVMFPYQKNVLEQIFGKSATQKMAYHATIPILFIPQDK